MVQDLLAPASVAQGAGPPSPECAGVAEVVAQLQGRLGQQLWPREQPSLVHPMVPSAAAVALFVQTGGRGWRTLLGEGALLQLGMVGAARALDSAPQSSPQPLCAVTECFVYDTDLRDQWCTEALRWTCGARSRHAASRSHQVRDGGAGGFAVVAQPARIHSRPLQSPVRCPPHATKHLLCALPSPPRPQAFCALRPVLGAQSASAMLAALHKCLAPGRGRSSDASSLDAAVECLCSLRALLAGLLAEPAKALLYPQLLLACVALLNSSVVRVVELAMHLLLQVGWGGVGWGLGALVQCCWKSCLALRCCLGNRQACLQTGTGPHDLGPLQPPAPWPPACSCWPRST